MILSRILRDREYINVATADASGRPNAAPKFILKYEKPFIYLVDFITATTVANLFRGGVTSSLRACRWTSWTSIISRATA